MGYTHYWTRPAELNRERFKRFTLDVARVIDHAAASLTLTGPDDDIDGRAEPSAPLISPDVIIFNGGAYPQGHEDLVIEQVYTPPAHAPLEPRPVERCKTERKPYDLAVVATLIIFAHHFPDASVTSDGDREDWVAGLALVERVLGYGSIPPQITPRPVKQESPHDQGPDLFDDAH